MFGIGFQELLVVLVVALLIFGPTKLPELARSLGKAMGEFRRASADLRQTLVEATDERRIAQPPPRPAAKPPESAAAEKPSASESPEKTPVVPDGA